MHACPSCNTVPVVQRLYCIPVTPAPRAWQTPRTQAGSPTKVVFKVMSQLWDPLTGCCVAERVEPGMAGRCKMAFDKGGCGNPNSWFSKHCVVACSKCLVCKSHKLYSYYEELYGKATLRRRWHDYRMPDSEFNVAPKLPAVSRLAKKTVTGQQGQGAAASVAQKTKRSEKRAERREERLEARRAEPLDAQRTHREASAAIPGSGTAAAHDVTAMPSAAAPAITSRTSSGLGHDESLKMPSNHSMQWPSALGPPWVGPSVLLIVLYVFWSRSRKRPAPQVVDA